MSKRKYSYEETEQETINLLCYKLQNTYCDDIENNSSENAELIELRKAILSKETGKRVLKRTYDRYCRYLLNISDWNENIYIKNNIDEYIESYDLFNKMSKYYINLLLSKMKYIDIELINLVENNNIDNSDNSHKKMKNKLKKIKQNIIK